jgi:ribosomal RNA-processing protein 17
VEFQRILKDTEQRILDTLQDSESDDGNDGLGGEEWQGFEDPPPVDYEAEYIDEDKYTTVTVEEMGLSRDELQAEDAKRYGDSEKEGKSSNENADESTNIKKKLPGPKKPKQKKKKFRYESKAERKITTRKERTGNRKQAKARREQ